MDRNYLILCGIFLVFFILMGWLVHLSEKVDAETKVLLQKEHSIDQGRTIARNAFLIYLSERDGLDTLHIDRLLDIEDSIQRNIEW